jgi:hypothetical protein
MAVAAPLSVVALAYGLATLSDRLLYIGPLDRATFGWSVVIPIWAAAPLAAGLAWRPLASRARMLAAGICGLAVGGVSAALVWLDVAGASCVAGPARGPIEWLLPATTFGLVIGGGFAITGLAASWQVREGHPWRAFAFGTAGQLVIVGAAAVLVVLLFFGVCQRP